MAGVFVAFAYCLVRAVDQELIEFPHTHQVLVEGEATGWTNIAPEVVLQMKQEGVIITTNGVDVANPLVVKKLQNSRVMGTLVYPNALAGLILLLLPTMLVLASTQKLRPAIRRITLALVVSLSGLAFFWSGSKFGWLIAMGIGGLYLFRQSLPGKWKIAALIGITLIGLGAFAIRFHHYFAAGATSASARLDYWRAAVEITARNPVFGTGPGTFQHSYASIKSPAAEMTRLTHNDYLEQFCDSGIPGGIFYTAWIVLAFVVLARRLRKSNDPLLFALFAGVLAWFVQGFGEFSLYVPALAWTAGGWPACVALIVLTLLIASALFGRERQVDFLFPLDVGNHRIAFQQALKPLVPPLRFLGPLPRAEAADEPLAGCVDGPTEKGRLLDRQRA